MDMGLSGKVVVITGATAGLGKACIPVFLAEGCKVAVCGRDEKKIAAVRAEYPEILALRADASKRQDLEQLARETASAFGGIDIWVNNAGIIGAGKALLDLSEEQWDATMDTNFKGVFIATQVAVPFLVQRGGGVIVNASSIAATMPAAGSGAYGASKAGVSVLTKIFAAELAPKNIRVVEYVPAVFDTDMNAKRLADAPQEVLAPIALRRAGRPEELAPAIVFLASDKATYITGTGLSVTGGKFCVQNPALPWN